MYKTKFLRILAKKTLFEYLKDSWVKPAHLLLIRIIFALITGIVLLIGNYIAGIVFLTIYQFVFLLDYVDGAIARHRKIFSDKWRRVDRTSHYLISAFFLFAISYSYYIDKGYHIIFLLGGLGSICVLLTFLVDTLWLAGSISFKELVEVHGKRGLFAPIYSFLPIDGPFTIFYILFVFDLIQYSIIFYFILNSLIFLKKVYNFIKWEIKKK